MSVTWLDREAGGYDTDRSKVHCALGELPGLFCVRRGGGVMRPARGDGFLTTAEAAALAGVSPSTVRDWRSKGYLEPQGLDERNRPLHTAAAVREAEQRAREAGLKASGIDPRRLRRAAFPAAALA